MLAWFCFCLSVGCYRGLKLSRQLQLPSHHTLQAELARHNDTVVLRGEDTYKNLPNKTLRLLRYALAHPAGGRAHGIAWSWDAEGLVGPGKETSGSLLAAASWHDAAATVDMFASGPRRLHARHENGRRLLRTHRQGEGLALSH